MADGVKRTVKAAYEVYKNTLGLYADAPRGAEVYVHPDDVERFDRLQEPSDPLTEAEIAARDESGQVVVAGVMSSVDPETGETRRGPGRPRKEG